MSDSAPAVAHPAAQPGTPARRTGLTVVPAPGDTRPAAGPPRLRLLPVPRSDPPYDDEPGVVPTLRLVPPAPVRGRAPAPAAPAPVGRELPPARPFAVALVRRMLEVRGGVRPVLQLRRDTTPGLYADLEQALRRRPRTTSSRPTSQDVRSVHVQQRPEGVAEVCATVARGDRMGALALRLEAVGGRWLCTQVMGL